MPLYANWQSQVTKPVGATQNLLRPHYKWRSVAMYTDEDVIIAAAAVIILIENGRREARDRRYWVRPIVLKNFKNL